ncbi:hypothetical protein VD659_18150 [Herbiconiux sp. 11R-BC]|uniref:hypothetical protein n=1 Tax=Herbiconiux sp. 11R-BC TaxID=3111637 RepID=UPI003C0AA80E
MHQANEFISRAAAFEHAAHELFSRHETSHSRVVQLDESYKKISALNIKQDELMRQALRCVEEGLYRAAHVMAWAAFMDFYEEILSSDGLAAVRRERGKWDHATAIEDLREYRGEYALLELAQPLKISTKNEMQSLIALLNKRNQCAHPSSYIPDLNASLGYISEVLHYVKLLNGKAPA